MQLFLINPCFNYFCSIVNTETKQAKKFVELIEAMPFAKILDEPNSTTKEALDHAKKGLTTMHKNAKELAAFLNK